MDYLVTKGAHINQATNDGKSPLYIASCEGQLSIVECLETQGTHIDQADKNEI